MIAIARRVYKAGPDGPEAAARILRDALRNTTTQAQVDAICALHADYLRWHDRRLSRPPPAPRHHTPHTTQDDTMTTEIPGPCTVTDGRKTVA